jgi:uncharacterized BrkB/YihY/UPF0761 family membrane protein
MSRPPPSPSSWPAAERGCASKSAVAATSDGDTQVSEVIALVRAYAEQETIGPLKGLARYLLLGLVGSVLIAIGVILLDIALLRLLQTETGDAFDGNWSWVPYIITLAVTGIVAALALTGINRSRAKKGAPS